jgi:hypothetical protein
MKLFPVSKAILNKMCRNASCIANDRKQKHLCMQQHLWLPPQNTKSSNRFTMANNLKYFIYHVQWRLNEQKYGALVEWYWQKSVALGEKLMPVPLRPLHTETGNYSLEKATYNMFSQIWIVVIPFECSPFPEPCNWCYSVCLLVRNHFHPCFLSAIVAYW